MSEDYYLICKTKKLYMPIFTMNMGGIGLSDKRWIFDFVLAAGGESIEMLHENLVESEQWDKDGWTFMNAWHPYKEAEHEK
jgi:hypothetical protein